MNLECQIDPNTKIDMIQLHKMAFLYNAVENGWTIRKSRDRYIFTKKHGGKKEIFLDSYLKTFMKENFTIKNFDNPATYEYGPK